MYFDEAYLDFISMVNIVIYIFINTVHLVIISFLVTCHLDVAAFCRVWMFEKLPDLDVVRYRGDQL